MKVIKPLTYKSRIQQTGESNKFLLQDNEVFATTEGCIIAPRYLYTDNITFINNTFTDIRASHIHDIGCAFGQIITSPLTEKDLIEKGLLRLNEKATKRECNFLKTLKEHGLYNGNTDVLVFVCEDIPKEYIEIKNVSFATNNELFRQTLKATGVNNFLANTMANAVYFNVGWFYQIHKPKIDVDKIFDSILLS